MTLGLKNILKTVIAALLLFIMVGCVHKKSEASNEPYEEVVLEVNAAFNGLIEAVKSLDTGRYFQFFDEGRFTSMNADGTVFHNLTDFKDPYREQIAMIQKYESLQFQNVKVTVVNNTTAVLVNEYQASVVLKSGEKVLAAGAGTQVWSKATGVWKLINISSSSKN